MSGGGGSNQTQTTNIKYPGHFDYYAATLQNRADDLTIGSRGNGAQGPAPYPFPDQQISPLTQQQQQGLQMAEQRAINGSPVMNAAQGNLVDTLQGRYLDPGSNPAWAPMAQRITDAYKTGTAAQTDAAAARANAIGSSGYQEFVGMNQRALGDTLAGAAGDLYNQERQRQMQANLFAPQAAAADYADASALLGVGDTYREYNQDLLNNQFMNQYQRANWPYQQLDILGNALRMTSGGATQQSTTGPNPYKPNKAANALGGGMSGAATGAMIGSAVPGLGTGVGALVGGGIGLLGGLL